MVSKNHDTCLCINIQRLYSRLLVNNFSDPFLQLTNAFSMQVDFVRNKQIHPVISHVVGGMNKVDELFEIMKRAENFGKLVVTVSNESDQAKL